MAGTLALVGAGEFLETMNDVDRALLDRAGGMNVVILPTASAPDGPGVPDRWIRMGIEHFTRLGARVEGVLALDRAACDDPANASRVHAADLVYFSGGKPDYLRQALENTATWSAALHVLDRGGVLVGCSAGAMIMGSHVPEFSLRVSSPSVKRWHQSFGLIPDVIVVPHYDEFPEFMVNLAFGRRPPGTFLVGIDGHTALVGSSSSWQVLGRGRVTVRRGRETRHYTAGQSVSWTIS